MLRPTVGRLVTLILSLFLAPLAAEAQPSAKVARIGYLSPAGGGAIRPLTVTSCSWRASIDSTMASKSPLLQSHGCFSMDIVWLGWPTP